MNISSNQYFAVESLARLANCDASRPCPTKLLAASINCSQSFTEQLMADLAEVGLVTAADNPQDGYYLKRPAHRITIAEILCASGELRDAGDLSLATLHASDSEIESLTGTNLLWEALNSYIVLFLEGVSLADIATAINEAYSESAGHTIH